MSDIRHLWLAWTLFFASLACANPPFPAHGSILEKIAFSHLDDLQIIGADTENDKYWRWAAWSESSENGPSVKLALLNHKTKNVDIKWYSDKQDAYGPVITRVVNWRHGQHPILVLTYRQGAEAQQVELYGLDEKNRPLLLDKRLGEQIEWRIGIQGETVLSIYSKPYGHLVPVCYGWQDEKKRLESLLCP
ncbi:MAG: hypothetical protein DM484_25870 [Candidatus Methylumidiphilus alinenensis]|uniref:Lipoprotein n=1 Tax=Candidatus Methylumidiphilus alinenensis TaxID=2202197 RepID=A0A2W4QML9_9GAMM|nr:MAG: hypothetical protein DM484_25870 [Candidatus Methylumidiphilus alinenensis]